MDIIKNFFEKKIAGSIVFWLSCGLAYLLIAVIGAVFFPDSKSVSQNMLIVDMTSKVDFKFLLIVFIAIGVTTAIGLVTQAIIIKNKGGFEIIGLVLEAGIGQAISFGSIYLATSAMVFFYRFAINDSYPQDKNSILIGLFLWLMAFVAYWTLERLKTLSPKDKETSNNSDGGNINNPKKK